MGLLKKLYNLLKGKNYQEVWKQFAKENDGSFIPAHDVNNDKIKLNNIWCVVQ
jgi:hypothetical protein